MARVPEAEPVPSLPGAYLAFAPFAEPDPELLTAPERALFETFTGRKRRTEWFAGRLAARAALRCTGAGAVSILRADNGAPRLEGPHADQVELAITHGHGLAAAVATRKDAAFPHVGVDLVDASDQPRVEKIAYRVLKDHERDLCAEAPDLMRVCWGAREAVAKATRTGMFVYALTGVSVTGIEGERAEIDVPGVEVFFRFRDDGGVLVLAGASAEAVAAAQAVAAARENP